MAIQRDLGISKPSDLTQGILTIVSAGRSAKRFVARGSRHSANMRDRQTWASKVGDAWFKNSLPKSTVEPLAPNAYPSFIDLRKTKIVDTIKESLTGQEYRAGIDTLADVKIDNELDRATTTQAKTFWAKLTGLNIKINNIWRHGWVEVVWSTATEQFITLTGGRLSTSTDTRAIHSGSNGLQNIPHEHHVLMTITRTVEGSWEAIFVSNQIAKVFAGVITSIDAPLDNAQRYSAEVHSTDQGLNVSNHFPENHLIPEVNHFPCLPGDPCLIFRDEVFGGSSRLIVFNESHQSIGCPTPPSASQIGNAAGSNNNVFFASTPSAEGAIGQAL